MVAATVEQFGRGAMPVAHASDPRLLSVGRGAPNHYYSQSELIDAFTEVWNGDADIKRRMSRLHNAVQVGGRHLALSIPEYLELKTFGQANDAFIRVGTDVAEKAVSDALEQAGLEASEVDAIFFTTVTGLAPRPSTPAW